MMGYGIRKPLQPQGLFYANTHTTKWIYTFIFAGENGETILTSRDHSDFVGT